MARVQNAPVNVTQFSWKPIKLFPFNPSLEDELDRLFSECCLSHVPNHPTQNDVWDDFKQNGRDYEYSSDQEDKVVVLHHNKKKNKKPLPTECVFCKNNGEDAKIYKKHLLKDVEGRTICPILRKYTCPICGAKGDSAHTLKYCPLNKQNHAVAPMNALKALRNSTGRRRSK